MAHVSMSPLDLAGIDLDELRRVASLEGEREVVTRRWLKQVLVELEAGRAAQRAATQTALACRGFPIERRRSLR